MTGKRPGLGSVADGVIACREGRIVYAGEAAQAPADLDALERIDCDGRCITPGLIDCHTHLIFAGHRAQEFELRLAGASYEQISKGGGGIISSVLMTRRAPEDALLASALVRVDRLIGEGVTTIEVKSGYGLSLAHETKILRVADRLAQCRDVAIHPTFLGAHALPLEYVGDADGYIDVVCNEMIPALARAGLCRSVDAFCEGIGFTPAQTRRVFQAAVAHGLRVKLHADQLSNQHGAALAAEFNALSADHLEYADEAGIRAMAAAGTVAVLLPGAYYFTREKRPPPLDLLRGYGVPIAIATDCNPGTSPLTSLLLAMNVAATCFRASVAECLAGVTREAARALGLYELCGTLEAGKQCDLAIWNVESPAELVYWMGANPLHSRVRGGHA